MKPFADRKTQRLIILAISMGLIACSIYSLVREVDFSRNAVDTTGEVVSYWEGGGGRRCAVVRYRDARAGVWHAIVPRCLGRRARSMLPGIGTHVAVTYRRDDPDRVRIDDSGFRWLLPLVFAMAGALGGAASVHSAFGRYF